MLYIFITFALLAGGITVNKYILEFLTPAWFVALRMSLAGIILLIYNIRHLNREVYTRLLEDWKLLGLVAACTTLVPSLLKAFGLKHLFAAKSTLLASIDPFVTAIFAYWLWNEKLTWRKSTGIFFGCLGMIIIASARTSEEISWQVFWYISYPELAVLAAVTLSRYGWILAQDLLKKDRYTPTQINGIIMLLSGALAWMMAWVDGEPFVEKTTLPLPVILLFISSIVAANVIGYAMYAHCLKKYSATLISLAGFLVPLLVALFAHIWLQEPLPMAFFLASGSIFIGLFMFYLDARAKKIKLASQNPPVVATKVYDNQ